MSYEHVTDANHLERVCDALRGAERIGFDTEFVSEDTFRPQLCLIQVASEHLTAVIDPLEIEDLSPFWKLLSQGEHLTIAHAAREEVNFSLHAVGEPPANLFDTQIAAAFCSHEYPAAYSSVVSRFLNRRVAKGEQRTDWRRRPLTDAQIDYALEDVRYLHELHDAIWAKIVKRNRQPWLEEETASFLTEVTAARTRQRWRKVSGIGNLKPRNLAIVREVWLWRQQEAERRDLPPRRILRDDLIVELAKQKVAKPEKIRSIRGMQYGQLKKRIDEITECVQRGLDAPLDDFRRERGQAPPPQLNLLGQFLSPAIASVCRGKHVAASLTGTASDFRDMIAYHLGYATEDGEPPALSQGWRAELIGNLINDLLDGKKSIRIKDPKSEHPLAIDGVDDDDED
ncbi:MAG: ribonuclease D [Planctomycetales bacterium]|nr:ribonuclease D [Planctomycetales bacterium]